MTPTLNWPQRLAVPVALPGTGEIHLWRSDLDELSEDLDSGFSALSPSEQERARRFVFGEPRRRYIVCRAWLRSVLGGYLNQLPHDVPLAANVRGKPCVVARENHAGLQFNLSHCGQFALLAITTGPEVGVDLQSTALDTAWPAIAERFYTPVERKHIQTLPPETRTLAFAEIWTRKEAAVKALGEGLTSQVFFIAVGPASWGLVDCRGGLLVWSLPAQARFAAAVAVRQSS